MSGMRASVAGVKPATLFPAASRPVTIREALDNCEPTTFTGDDPAKNFVYRSAKRRNRWDGQVCTLSGRMNRHGLHPSENRYFSLEEMARLQSFPDGFRFAGTPTQRTVQTGNSVPPMMARAVAGALAEGFFGRETMELKLEDYGSYRELLGAAWDLHLAPRGPGAPTVVSAFAGCGGSSLGYSMAGYRELLATDFDEKCAATFRANFPGVPFLVADVRGLTAERLMAEAGLAGPGELNVLDGSPPCQGFSTAGKRDLWDPRNELYREFARLLEGTQPRAFVMENVSGMVKGKMKLAFADCTRALKAAGYQVSCKLMNAKYFYVPQNRERLIWIGIRRDLQSKVNYPRAQSKLITSEIALANLYDNVSERAILEPKHKTYQQMKIVKSGDRCKLHHSHHRLHHNKVAPTIDRGGGAGAYHVWHFAEHRPITTFELRRLFSFPDQFERISSVNDFFEQLGNSVPPLFMRAIAQHIRQEILSKI